MTCPLCNDTGAQRYWEGRWRDERAENERLQAALIRFADRSNWYFEGDHMCPEWMGKDLPWDYARSLCEQQMDKP